MVVVIIGTIVTVVVMVVMVVMMVVGSIVAIRSSIGRVWSIVRITVSIVIALSCLDALRSGGELHARGVIGPH